MTFFNRNQVTMMNSGPRPFLSATLLIPGLILVFSGIAILAAPELLAYFVATLLILGGFSLIGTWMRLRR